MFKSNIKNLCAAALLCCSAVVGVSAETPNPNQEEIDRLKQQKELIDAKKELIKSENELEKERYPAIPAELRKDGTLTIESAERDKFHVTARSADAFAAAAKKLASKVKRLDKDPVVILSDADRNAIAAYRAEMVRLDRIRTEVAYLLKGQIASSESVLAATAVLSQLVQIAQVFRENKSVSFTDSLLPDELLLDLVVLELKSSNALYPAGLMDSILSGDKSSGFSSTLDAMLKLRTRLRAIKTGPSKDAAAAVVAEMDEMATRLVAVDPTTKLAQLMTVTRGEMADGFLTAAKGRVFSIRIVSKGGASLKTSSVFRGDRLYAAGGVIVSYRLTSGGDYATIEDAGVVTEESSFVEVPLKQGSSAYGK